MTTPPGDEHSKLVRTITEQVMSQMKTELTNMRARITQLETRVDVETNKRIQLEEEMRKITQQTHPQPHSPTEKEHPAIALSKKPFLRGSYTDLPDKRSGLDISDSGTRARSDTGNGHQDVNTNINNKQSSNSNNSTQYAPATTPPATTPPSLEPPSRAVLKTSNEGKSEWVKAPLPRDSEVGKTGDTTTNVNDTILFDTASDRIVKEGSLEKMGKTRPSWKVRWVRLQPGTLFYFKTQKDKKPIGEISLQNCNVFRSTSKKPFEFTISVPMRDWLFSAKDEEEAQGWVEAVTSCSSKATIYYQ